MATFLSQLATFSSAAKVLALDGGTWYDEKNALGKEAPMKKGRKKLLCLLLALFLLAGTLLPPASAATVTFTALNDRLLTLSDSTMPVTVNGIVYVPYTTFDSDVTGISLGIYYGRTTDKLVLYSKQTRVTFDLNSINCYDDNDNVYSAYALVRSGRPYVPVAFVCAIFGLRYSYSTTDYGALVRICNQDAANSDSEFIEKSALTMQNRLNSYNASTSLIIDPPDPPAVEPPANNNNSSVEVPVDDTPDALTIQLAFRCTEGNLGALLDLLDQGKVQALLLLDPESLADQADQIRRAVAGGHTLGFTLDSALSSQEQLEVLESANELLAALCYTRCYIADLPEGGAQARQALTDEGWLCWRSQLTYSGASAASLTRTLRGYSSAVRLTMGDDELSRQILPAFLRQVNNISGWTLACPTETHL